MSENFMNCPKDKTGHEFEFIETAKFDASYEIHECKACGLLVEVPLLRDWDNIEPH